MRVHARRNGDSAPLVQARGVFSPPVLHLLERVSRHFFTHPVKSKGPWIEAAFGICAFVAAGIWLACYSASLLFNRTYITVNRRDLILRSGPIRWSSGTFAASTLDQLYCKESILRGRNGTTISHEVWATFRDGTTRKILANGMSAQQALYIEQQIEMALGIPDRPVPGEMTR